MPKGALAPASDVPPQGHANTPDAPAPAPAPAPADGTVESPRSHVILFCAGQGLSAVGGWMQKTAVGWLAWDLTHSAAWVGVVALSDLIAAPWVGTLAGVMADRYNPYRLLVAFQAAMIVQALVLYGLAESGWIGIAWLVGMSVLDATIQGFNQPVRMTVIGTLAGRARMAQAIAANSIAFNVARGIGPALAGFAMIHGSVGLCFLGNAVSFVAMLAAVLALRRRIDRARMPAAAAVSADVAEGFRYLRRTPEIATLFLLVVAFSLLGRPFTELMPALAGGVFKGGPETLSLLLSLQGVGAVIGASWMLRRRPPDRLPRIAFGAAFGMSASLIVFTATDRLAVAAPAMVVAGLCHVVCNIGMQSMAQLLADPALKGRVLSLYMLLFRAGPAAGAFAMGVATEWIPLRGLVGGGALLAAAVVVWLVAGSRRGTAIMPATA